MEDPDGARVYGQAVYEVLCAIQGIEYPNCVRRDGVRTFLVLIVFLADDAVEGEAVGNGLYEVLLALTVRDGDRVGACLILVLGFDLCAEVLCQDGAAATGDLRREAFDLLEETRL